MSRVSPRCALLLGAVFTLGLSSACAGARPATREDDRRLEAKVAELRAQARRDRRTIRDLENRILILKEQLAATGQQVGEGSANAVRDGAAGMEDGDPWERPDLPVEIVGANPEEPRAKEPAREVAGLTADGYEIVYAGDALSSEPLRLSGERQELAAEPARQTRAPRASALPEIPETGERLPVIEGKVPRLAEVRKARSPQSRARKRSFGDPKEEYRRYYGALRSKDHAAAIAGFRNFLERFPRHEYADNARYWLGEAFYDQKRYRPAMVEFEKVVADYPRGGKVPDALLKIAYCQAHLGDVRAARATLRRVIEEHPGTNPAALARRRIKELEE